MDASPTLTALPSSPLEAFRRGLLGEFHRVPAGNLEAALDTPHPVNRDALAGSLRAYLERIGAPKAALASIEALAHPNSRVIVAGQQAGLLGGPAYTFSKAINAILLAQAHTREDRPVVPVFWIASQDHDALEVCETFLLDFQETEHHLCLPLPSGRPVGRLALEPAWVERTLEVLRAFDGTPEWQSWIINEVEAAAQESTLYAEWFARLILRLLGPKGLIVFDPLAPELAGLFKAPLQRELEDPLAGPAAIERAAHKLEGLGFQPQLRRPPGSTNLFLEGDDGERRLLRFEHGHFHTDREYTPAELEAILETDPSRLTPAAGLRPILADAVLPSAVSILGPNELAYQLELLGVYELHGVPQPLLWPRLSVTFLEPPVRRILKKFNLSAAEYSRDPEGSLERLMMQQTGAGDQFRAGLVDLELAFERLASNLDAIDTTLHGTLERSRARVMGHVARLERKIAAGLVHSENTLEGQFDRLGKHLRPGGVPQERRTNFLGFLMKFGPYALERVMGLEPTGAHWIEIE